jgi:hypothetical protein
MDMKTFLVKILVYVHIVLRAYLLSPFTCSLTDPAKKIACRMLKRGQQQGFQPRIGQTQFLRLHLLILSLGTSTAQDTFSLLNIKKVVSSKGLGILKHQ